jgi:tRNA nucleotidyltransferase (CCA-adding enzyme)
MTTLLKKVPKKCLNIMKTITSANAEAYLVGGCVRDIILKRKVRDWDIVTNLTPESLVRLFPSGHYHGKSFGVVTVAGIEISTFRSDTENVSSLIGDLGRRDFTFNAMAIDLSGTVLDPFEGKNDLKNKTVRFVGNPCDRIKEDPCRMIRGVRFVGLLGGSLDSCSEQAIREMRTCFPEIAKERVRAEIIKIMDCEYLIKAFESMNKTGLLEFALPLLYACRAILGDEQGAQSVYEHSLKCASLMETDNPILRLAALFHGVGKPLTFKHGFSGYEKTGAEVVRKFMTDMRFSNSGIDYVSELVEKQNFNSDGTATMGDIRKFLSRLTMPVHDYLCFRHAESKTINSEQRRGSYYKMKEMIEEVISESPPLSLKDLEISGQDLKEMGLTPGPFFSEVLDACLEKTLEEPLFNEKQKLREFAQNYILTR